MNARRISRPGVYEGFTEPVYDGWRRSSRYVTMRDGVRLAVDIVRPCSEGELHEEPLPVLWSHTPYTRAVVTEDGGVAPAPIEGWDRMLPLVAHGYVVALVDVRGGGASFGRSNGMFSPAESDDAHEITEWLAPQAWSDGNIGMWGRSYLGITQLLCASRQPPHLRAIFPEMAWWDAYDVIHPGGIFRHDLTAMWSAGVRALDLGLPMMVEDVHGEPVVNMPAAPVDDDVEGLLVQEARRGHYYNRDVFGLASGHRHRNSIGPDGEPVWPGRSPGRLRDAIAGSGVAIYHYVGWYDGFTRDACLAFADLPNPQKLLIDPNYHSEYFLGDDRFPAFDLRAEQRRWFDHWLKGIDNGIMDEPAVTYWLLGADVADPWRTAAAWPVPGVERMELFLAAGPTGTVESANDGSLVAESPPVGADAHVVDFSTTVGPANRFANLAGGEGRVLPFEDGPHLGYPDLADNDARGLTYTGEQLAEDLELVGHPVVRLWVEADTTVDVFAYLEEVLPDGFSRYLSEGCLRTSHRAESDPPYEHLGMPWHPSGEGDLLEPGGEAVRLAFDLQPVGTLVRAGSRIRLTLTGADRANHEPLDVDPPPTIRVRRGGDHASVLEIPRRGSSRS